MPLRKQYVSVRQLLAECNTLPVENFVVEVGRKGKDLVLSPEALSALMKVDTNGRLHGMADTSGRLTEVSALSIKNNTGYILDAVNRPPTASEADGTGLGVAGGSPGWVELLPVVITAAADGSLAAAAAIFAFAVVGRHWDAEIYFQVDTTGSYQPEFCQDTGGTPAAIYPDWFASPPNIPCVAGYRYGPYRMNATADEVDFGIDAMAAGAFPNNASMVVYGHYRSID